MQLIANIGLLVTLQAVLASADACPPVHVFGARGTGVPPGYDLLLPLVEKIKSTHAGATSDPIVYPACGGIPYAESAKRGTAAVATAVNELNKKCPDTKIVLMGYSQGGQIIDNALCGGGDSTARVTDTAVPISPSAVKMVKAAILMGNPRFQSGFPYEVGTCKASGFEARPAGFTCPNGGKIQSYCDAADPYCCKGHDGLAHQAYVKIYGQQSLEFVNSKLAG